jgi:hypothetical protein
MVSVLEAPGQNRTRRQKAATFLPPPGYASNRTAMGGPDGKESGFEENL